MIHTPSPTTTSHIPPEIQQKIIQTKEQLTILKKHNANRDTVLALENILNALTATYYPELVITSSGCEERLASFIGEDPSVTALKDDVRRIVNQEDPVLITGESGTGKELIARALHGNRTGKFIDVNCAAIARELFESELFGHEKGSFTGALFERPGKMQEAWNGTLFLDEIGEMPLSAQAKLLRSLQEMVCCRVGSNKNIDLKFRLVCATNRSLTTMIEDKLFRPELYYRIATFELTTPALRNRPSDMDDLIRHISKGKLVPPYPGKFGELVRENKFPGNVRELQFRVRRWLILGRV